MSSTHNPAITYRPEIDGLRAVAVLPVILFHAGTRFFSGGYVGVDVFFVISGYLITSIILNEMEQRRFSVSRFYERRARRILPGLFFVTLCCLPFAWMWSLPDELRRFGQGLMAISTFSSNIYFWRTTDYFAPAVENQPLLHTWSLAVEEQYYLLFPLFLMFCFRFGRKTLFWLIATIAVSSILFSEWGWRNSSIANFYLLPSRAWELLAGSLLALIPASTSVALRQKGWLSEIGALSGLCLIIFAILRFDASTPFPSLYTIVPVAGAVLIISFVNVSTVTGAILASRPFVGLGLISYSAYLWHQPVFAFARMNGFKNDSRIIKALLVLTILLLAWLSWRFIEDYFRRPRLRQKTIFLLSSLSLTVLLAIGFAIHANAGFPSRFLSIYKNYPEDDRQFTQDLLRWENKENDNRFCKNAKPSGGLAVCEVGLTNKPTVDVIVWGDSLAGALAYGMNTELLARGKKGLFLISDACPPIKNLSRPGVRDCNAQTHEKALNIISSAETVKTVLLLGNIEGGSKNSDCRLSGQKPTWAAAKESISEVSHYFDKIGKTLIVVQQGPSFPEDAYSFYLRERLRGQNNQLSVKRSDYEQFTKNLSSLIEVTAYLDTTDFFCDESNCSATHNGKLFIYDNAHYTFAGSVALAKFILETTNLLDAR